MTGWSWRVVVIALMGLAVTACSKPAPQVTAPPVVGVINAEPTSVPVVDTYPGRLSATLTAEVRPRVTGIVLKRVYHEGTDVKVGDVLFRIDPAPLQASLRMAQGQLAQAEANAKNAELKAERDRALAGKGLIAKQDVADSVAAAEAGAAGVKAARAAVENAKISLGYATITAPISGRAGRANVTQGALVSPTDTAPLTTIQVVDPIYANFSEPMAQVIKLKKAATTGDLKQRAEGQAEVRLVLADGSVYAHPGTLEFTDLAVDPSTGAVDLRATVPNPEHLLLPGMFVDVRLTRGTLDKVYLVPQGAIQRDDEGAFVYVVGAQNEVQDRRVELGEQKGGAWIVTAGLADGDRVVVSGIQSVRAGIKVKPTNEAADAESPSPTSAPTVG